MDKIHEIAGAGGVKQRFDDGTVNMAELIRVMAEPLVNEIMDAKVEEACGSGNRRNGYRERKLVTSVGTINLRILKLRAGSYFPEDLIERYSRADRAVIVAVSEMAADGVPARKVKRAARTMVFPGAAWQRCIVHLMRNADGNAPTRQKKGAVLGILEAVFAERGPELVRGPCQLATAQIEGFCPKAAEVPEETEADAPAYLDFPYEHHVRLRTNSVQERANREPRRRSRVAQIFPSRKSLIRMMGAVFSEMDEDWAGRRWFGDDAIGRAVEGAKVNEPAHAYEGTAAEHAARIIALVVADNPIPGRKAA